LIDRPLRRYFFTRANDLKLMESSMPVVIFTEPTGGKTAINSAAWHTVSKGEKGLTQIGFSGAQMAILVKEPLDDVIKALEKAEKS
jgi:hypothetical protein